MASPFTIGIEEEFQIVDRKTGQLSPHILTIMEKGAPIFGEQIKPEMLQSTVELISPVYPSIAAARLESQRLRGRLAELMEDEGHALVSAGTHPGARWLDQKVTPNPRYYALLEELQDVALSILIFGLHVHIAVESKEMAVTLMNQLRTWVPHLLALSTNSPFWGGRLTGLKSYRATVWKRFPRNGLPDVFPSWQDFDRYVQALIRNGCIDNSKKIWWDIRPHPFFGTIEFRVCDMPATLDDVIAIAALCQALVVKLSWLHQRGMSVHILPKSLIEENKWRAIRYGLDAEIIDFVQDRTLPMRTSIQHTLDFVEDVLDELGTHREMGYLRSLLDDPRGTGADRQIALYKETGSIEAVTHYLMRQTLVGIPIDTTARRNNPLPVERA